MKKLLQVAHLVPLGLGPRVRAMRVPLLTLQIEPDPRTFAFRNLETQRTEQRLDISETDPGRSRRRQNALQGLALVTVQGQGS